MKKSTSSDKLSCFLKQDCPVISLFFEKSVITIIEGAKDVYKRQDTACVELKFANGSMIAINTIAVENEIADNMYQRSELDYLIYNDPIGYADLILNGDPETYLKTVTEYKPLDS